MFASNATEPTKTDNGDPRKSWTEEGGGKGEKKWVGRRQPLEKDNTVSELCRKKGAASCAPYIKYSASLKIKGRGGKRMSQLPDRKSSSFKQGGGITLSVTGKK